MPFTSVSGGTFWWTLTR